MVRLVVSMAVGIVVLACGQDTSAVPTTTPAEAPVMESTAIEYPEVTDMGTFTSMTLPCSFLLHTFYSSSDTLMKDALLTLRKEIESYFPKKFTEPQGTPQSWPVLDFSERRLTDLLMECHWQDEKRDELEKAASELKRESEAELEAIRQQLRDYTPTP